MADDQRSTFTLRASRELLDRLKAAAEALSHSMNAEIIQRLEQSFQAVSDLDFTPEFRTKLATSAQRAGHSVENEIKIRVERTLETDERRQEMYLRDMRLEQEREAREPQSPAELAKDLVDAVHRVERLMKTTANKIESELQRVKHRGNHEGDK